VSYANQVSESSCNQPFQVLALLLEHPGQVVTREELRQRLWPADTFVEYDHNLNSWRERGEKPAPRCSRRADTNPGAFSRLGRFRSDRTRARLGGLLSTESAHELASWRPREGFVKTDNSSVPGLVHWTQYWSSCSLDCCCRVSSRRNNKSHHLGSQIFSGRRPSAKLFTTGLDESPPPRSMLRVRGRELSLSGYISYDFHPRAHDSSYGRAQQINRVPKDNYRIEDIYDPKTLSDSHGYSDGDQLTDEHARKAPKSQGEMSHERIDLICTHPERNHCGQQIEALECNESPMRVGQLTQGRFGRS
jgi:hypothetical protein